MREWDVIGANRTTWATLTMWVLADDEEDATRTVGGAMLIERVLPAVADARAVARLGYASSEPTAVTTPAAVRDVARNSFGATSMAPTAAAGTV